MRWLENSPVANRITDILENLKTYGNHVQNDASQKPTKSSKSFKVVETTLSDKLLEAKLAFFISLAEDMETCLREFQADRPMAPFISQDLLTLLKCCMDRIVKGEVMNNKTIMCVDMKNPDNLKTAKHIDIGYADRRAIRQCKDVKDLGILSFRQECKSCLNCLVTKLIENAPSSTHSPSH